MAFPTTLPATYIDTVLGNLGSGALAGSAGPFVDGSGNVYIVGLYDNGTNFDIGVWKATDPSSSFTLQDNVLSAGNSSHGVAAVCDGTYIHIVKAYNTSGSTLNRVYYFRYILSTDTFAAASTIGGTGSDPFIAIQTTQTDNASFAPWANIALRSDGDVIITYHGDAPASMGGTYQEIDYSRLEGSTWTHGTIVASTGGKNDHRLYPQIAVDNDGLVGSGDQAHIIFQDLDANGAQRNSYTRPLSSTNTLRTVRSFSNVNNIGNSFPIGTTLANQGGVLKVFSAYASPGSIALSGFYYNHYTDDSAPTITDRSSVMGLNYISGTKSLNGWNILGIDLNGSTDEIYAGYSTESPGFDIGLATDGGTVGNTWTLANGGSAIRAAGMTTGVLSGRVIERDNAVKYGFIYNDSGTLKYDEFTIRTLIATHTASGTPSLNGVTVAGTATHASTLTASGTPTINGTTVAGTAERVLPASGAATTTAATAAGTATRSVVKTASGTVTTVAATVAGTAERVLTASGVLSTTALTSAGTAERILTATGAFSTTGVTVAGEATGLVELTASGAVAFTAVDTNAPVVSGKTYDAPTNASTFTINETCTLYVAWHLASAGIPTLNSNGTWTGTVLETNSASVTATGTLNPAYTTTTADRMTYGFIDADGNVSATTTEVFNSETALITGQVDVQKKSAAVFSTFTPNVDLSGLKAGDILLFAYGKNVGATSATVGGDPATLLGGPIGSSQGVISVFQYTMPADGAAATPIAFTLNAAGNGHHAVFAFARNAVVDGSELQFSNYANLNWTTGVTPTDANNAIVALLVGMDTHPDPYPFAAPLEHIDTVKVSGSLGALAIAKNQPLTPFTTFGNSNAGRTGAALISVSRKTKIETLGGQGTGVTAIRYEGTSKLSLTDADGGTTFTAKKGKNRLLICILQWGTGSWSGFPTVTIGGQTPVLHGERMGGDGNNASHIQIYYLKDADIPSGSIGMTVDFSTVGVPQLFARIIEKENVDQTTPLGAAVIQNGTTVTVNMTTATGEMLSCVSQRTTTGNGPWTVTTGTEIFDDMLGTQLLTVAIAEEQPGVTGNLTHTYTPTVGGNGQNVSGFEIFKAQPVFIPISPAVAYSTRRIVESYTGPLLRVRRVSDNAELDIGYDTDNWLDQSALLAHASGGDATVTTWYDQTGNGNHATSTVSTEQPKIVSAGVMVKYPNGAGTNRPYLTSGQNSLFEHLDVPSAIYSGWTAATAFAAWVQGTPGAGAQGAPYTFCADSVIHHIPYQNSNAYYGLFSTTRLGPLGMGIAHDLSVPTINAQMHTGSTSHLYYNGTQIGTGVSVPALENSGLTRSVILAGTANSLTAASIGEFVMYGTALSADDVASVNAYLAAGYMD